MGPLALLGIAALCAGLGRAEVDPGFTQCNNFFYGGKAPQGFDTARTADICQKFEGTAYFATLYDRSSRIPVWSAYTLDPRTCQETSSTWKVEPQLSGFNGADMQTEGDLKKETRNDIKNKNRKAQEVNQEVMKKLQDTQAIDADYDKTGYDRGHLNPNSFQCGDGCTATYTLTNAAPMDPCFNRVRWYELEDNLQKQLSQHCPTPKQNAFLVTGAVPNDHKYENYIMPIQNNNNKGAGRVVVPRYIWTAVCCDHSNNNEKFAFAFLGENKPGSILEHKTVTELNQKLNKLYGDLPNKPAIQIFKDDCNEGSKKAKDVLLAVTKELHNEFPSWEGSPGGKKRKGP